MIMKSGALRFCAILSFLILLRADFQPLFAEKCPCDIYNAGGTPCVAAHSMVRALYADYDGPLYQVRRKSDNQLKDIPLLTQGGYVNAAVQDSFLAGQAGTISKIYDQSPQANHLVRSPIGGWLFEPADEAIATDTMIMINGHKAYGCYTKRHMGYRNNVTKGIATGTQAEGMYMVSSGKSVNDSCCYDYGNAETNMQNNGTGTMETIYLGKFCWFGPCSGNGPWVLADLENGLFGGGTRGQNINNLSVPHDYVTAIVKGNARNYTIRAGNAQTGTLTTMAKEAPRPAPNKLEGAIVLGVGGDNSWAARGIFFEGAMTIGEPADSTEDAVQRNIIAAGYGRNFVSLRHGNHHGRVSQVSSLATSYNQPRSEAVISYSLSDASDVRMNIFNQQGRRIATVVDGRIAAGQHKAVWRAGRFPAGVYFWRIAVDGREGGTGKIIAGK